MKISIERLQNVKQMNGKITARCPACAEEGHDATGNHLCVFDDGKFACVVHPGVSGLPHRRKIMKLMGEGGELQVPTIRVRSTRFHRDGTVGTLFSHLRS